VSDFLLAMTTLWRREMVRFLRQRSRIVGALGTPLLFWLLLGSGVGSSFRLDSSSTTMDIWNTFSRERRFDSPFHVDLFDDLHYRRQKGRIPSRRTRCACSPIGLRSRQAVGGTTLAVMQGVMFMLLAPFVGNLVFRHTGGARMLALVAFGLTALGYIIAWKWIRHRVSTRL